MNSRILIIGPNMPTGGVARYVKDLLSWHGEFTYSLFDTKRPLKSNIKANITGYSNVLNAGFFHFIRNAFITFFHLFIFPFRLIKERPLIVHICGVSYMGFWENAYYMVITKLLGLPITIHYLGGFDIYYLNCKEIEKKLIEHVLQWAKKIVVLTPKISLVMSKFIEIDKISVIPSSIHTQHYELQNNKNTRDDGILQILFLGGADPFRKGVNDLLKAAQIICTHYPSIKFIISGGSEKSIKQTTKIVMPIERVEFVGWLSEQEKIELLHSVDIFVLPSYHEGLPYAIIEAMASGLPIVASSVGGIPDVIRNGENGFLIEPGDIQGLVYYLETLIKDSNLRESIGVKNHLYAITEYSVDTNLCKLEKIFSKVLYG